MTKIIGLTGGIGSGKTTIAHYIQSLGIPVYIADAEAKKIMDQPAIIEEVQREIGPEVVDDGSIVNSKLAAIVFKDPQKLKILNSIIHPAVKKHFERWCAAQPNQSLIVKEAAILFESGSYKDCDKVIVVTAPLEVRMNRVIKRDDTSKEAFLDRVNNQWTDEMRLAKADFVIENTTIAAAKRQVDDILKKI